MSRDQIYAKLNYDLFEDVENYNHSLPLVLLLLEFCVNNIPFQWFHFFLVILINTSYLFFQYNYCLITKEVVYQGIDWNNDAFTSLLKALSTTIVTFVFFIMIKCGMWFKNWATGI